MAPPPEGIAVLASGGVDSAILLHTLADRGERLHPVFVRQGFRWERAEFRCLERFLAAAPRAEFEPPEVLVLPLADLYPEGHFGVCGAVPAAGTPDEDCYLPGRNTTILAKTGVFAALRNLRAIALGALSGNPFPDASTAFFERTAKVLTEGLDHPLTIMAPFRELTKAEVLRRAGDLPLELTLSCLAPSEDLNCGHCGKCHERRKAFAEAGVPDPTTYGPPE